MGLGFFRKKEKQLLESTAGSGIVISEDFVNACIQRELSSLADDILQPYIFEGQFDNVYPYDLRGLCKRTKTIKDIIVQAMFGVDQIVNKIKIRYSGVDRVNLFTGEPDAILKDLKELLPGAEIKILSSVVFEKIYSQTDIDLLKLCFRSLGSIYNRQERVNYLDSKLIFKVKGLHSIFTAPKNHEEELVASLNREKLIANFSEILNGSAGIIDADDDIGLVGGGTADSFKSNLDISFQEIARILRIPATRLLGRSPDGMNATGESDALNYDMTLDSIRSGWLEPFLKLLDQGYEKVDKIDVDYIKKVAEMHVLFDIPLSAKLRSRIIALGEEM